MLRSSLSTPLTSGKGLRARVTSRYIELGAGSTNSKAADAPIGPRSSDETLMSSRLDSRRPRATRSSTTEGCSGPGRTLAIGASSLDKEGSSILRHSTLWLSGIHEHGGTIRVEDVVPHGTRFVIELPLARTAVPVEA